ncbi:MAG: hypothetical protein GAK29_02106 [Acinetobacter bereziniae]|uniref:Uncharacterized protein n=1 Tax=Acinetobacter bereziniae TaxID=106648 RepID=A0A833PFK1_ACIBZ|nr:MAG: hypothetical protein GAK29_02106 [Acinetobacter bereziniae]
MKFKILLLMVLSTSAYANNKNECKIVEDTADMIMQLRQGGVDLKNTAQLKDQFNELQNNLLQIMVIDAEGTPVYATHLDKQKAVSEFVANWKKTCTDNEL